MVWTRDTRMLVGFDKLYLRALHCVIVVRRYDDGTVTLALEWIVR